MRTIVRVRTPDAEYAVPVERVKEVRSTAGLTSLLEPRDGVAGVLSHGAGTITVLSLLAPDGRQIVVLEADELTFGLLVDEVTGVHQVADDAIGPSPVGQERAIVDGVLTTENGLVLLLDVAALARWLAR